MIENNMVRYDEPRLSYLQWMELQAAKRKPQPKKEPAIKPIDFILGRHLDVKR